VWLNAGFTANDLALYAGLASSRDKKDDAIDRSVIGYLDKLFGQETAIKMGEEYTKTRSVGFNPIYKRVLFEFSHPVHGKVTVAKGLPNKILDTADGGVDDAADQWKCEGFETLKDEIKKVDLDFSKAGYKTLGVAAKVGDAPWKYVGILPMLDPPRHDTAQTIKNLNNAGIEVKMITGDHLNIAIETARLIGLGRNIHAGSETREANSVRDELVKESNGFAQVLPRDKREVVLVLKEKFKYVVGMTGDGVNDAPALSAAQCGIAVDDATDAAKNAAAIILTSPGLSAIYSAVVESRRIFRKLKSYILYRFAATIQIVVVLSLLIFCSNCVLNSLYVILLALLNDITMLPIAYDRQQASKYPEHPDVKKLLIISTAFGVVETIISLAFAYGADRTTIFDGDLSVTDCTDKLQASVWLQMFIAAELLIFITRAPTFIFMSIRPSVALMVSALGGCLLVSILAATSSTFGKLSVKDIVLVWVYNFIFMIIVDCLKVYYYHVFNESSEVLDDKEEDEQAEEPAAPADEEAPAAPAPSDPHQSVRELSQASSLANATGSSVKSSMRSKSSIEDVISRPSVNYDTGRFVSTRSSRMGATASHFSLRGGALHTVGGSLRPNVPSLNPAKARLDHV
jgi:H+-transporting ATPase